MIQKGREYTQKADDIHNAMQSVNDHDNDNDETNNMMEKYRFYHQNGAAMMQHGHKLMLKAKRGGGLNPHRIQKWVQILSEMREWEQRFLALKRKIINKIRGNFLHIHHHLRRSVNGYRSFIHLHGPNGLKRMCVPKVVKGVLKSYMFYLRTAAHRRGWKKLSPRLQQLAQPYFKFPLNKIRYATNVNTLHGDPATFGYDIFFPKDLNPREDEADLRELFKQLEYVEGYEKAGGIWPFLMHHVFGPARKVAFFEIVQKRSLDYAGFTPLDHKMANAVEDAVRAVWQQYKALH